MPSILFSRKAAGLVAFLAWSAVFALLYTQLPLYASNQNQYYLHGLAHAGYGFLANDWLARTLDPTPVFSFLIELTYRVFHSEAPTHFYYAILIGVYGYALWGIADILFQLRKSTVRTLTFLAAFLTIHSTLFRFLLSRIWDGESAYVLEGGVAFQRVLGQFFQPSTFGVFLLLSIYLFLRHRRRFSILSLAVAIYFHSTYLLAGALITLGYLVAIGQEERQLKSVFWHGLLTLAAILPILVYALLIFGPTSPEIYQQAQNILVHYRIPQHALIGGWMRWTVYVQAALLIGAVVVTRKTRLFPIFSVAALGMFLLTLLQASIANDTLALLFPWRLSVILVPLSTTILLAAGVQWAGNRWPHTAPAVHRWVIAGCLAMIAGLMIVGMLRSALDNLATPVLAKSLQQYLRERTSSGEIIFIPPRMETFRLESGMAVYIDLKSIPYRDMDVIEWYRRLEVVNHFYNSPAEACILSQEIVRQEGPLTFLLPADMRTPVCPAWRIDYQDSDFIMVRLISNAPMP
jgi:hypothetical protein